MFDDFLRKAEELRTADEPFAIAVVVRSEPPVSGKPGYKAIIRADGTMWGWIGGGCTQPLVLGEALKAMEDGNPRLVRIAPAGTPEKQAGVTEYAMACHSGGALDVYVEPVLPRPHVVIFGKSTVAQTLARLAADIDYRVTIVADGAGPDCFPTASLIVDSAVDAGIRITPQTFVVVATQGDDDETALEQALLMQGPYLSFVASRTKAVKVVDYLADKGISRESTGHIKAPAGLDLHANTPEEIAVSILAEIVQTRWRKSPAEKPKTAIEDSELAGDPHRPVAAGQSAPVESARTQVSRLYQEPKALVQGETVRAKDPICGMEIDTLRAKYKSEYNSSAFYFCSVRCKEKFDLNPAGHATL